VLKEVATVLIIELCNLLHVYQLNIGITSVRNKVFVGASVVYRQTELVAHTSKPPHHTQIELRIP
jgi:hypothetical protein